ncbi:MAG: gluconate 2-dehydrogenase subunit 3 family protein [Bacteroidetes bacterium]|nr:gluconate 2-dehydrogenase subunit 3 family protein [Fibrella sp.]
MATAVAGLVSAPAWATNWSTTSIQPHLAPDQDALLAELVETMIPTTDTPGAKPLGVHTFVQKMVADCYDKPAQETLTTGLTTVEALARQRFNTDFAACDGTQRLALLQQMAAGQDPAQKTFVNLVKGLTIRGYLSSEYVMTNLTHFQMAPGYYRGCVPVTPKPVSSSSPSSPKSN